MFGFEASNSVSCVGEKFEIPIYRVRGPVGRTRVCIQFHVYIYHFSRVREGRGWEEANGDMIKDPSIPNREMH
jgi:hypothetical protein